MMGKVAVAHPERYDDAMLEADVLCQRRNADTNASLFRSIGRVRGLRPHLILGRRWDELAVPTVFLCGDRDAFVSAPVAAAWDAILARNPRIRMVRIPDAGHLLFLDAPVTFVDEVETFLGASRRAHEHMEVPR